MNRKNIVTLPHANLREKSIKISKFDDDLKKLVKDMTDASLDWEDHREHEFCVGLAATQIDANKRVVVLRDNLDDKSDKRFTAIINPKIIKTFGELEEDYEGCLSVADIYARVKRYPKVKIKAQDENGEEFRVTAEGFLARLLQHEIDHTNGIVIIDHVFGNPDGFFKIDANGKIKKMNYEKDIKDSDELW